MSACEAQQSHHEQISRTGIEPEHEAHTQGVADEMGLVVPWRALVGMGTRRRHECAVSAPVGLGEVQKPTNRT